MPRKRRASTSSEEEDDYEEATESSSESEAPSDDESTLTSSDEAPAAAAAGAATTAQEPPRKVHKAQQPSVATTSETAEANATTQDELGSAPAVLDDDTNPVIVARRLRLAQNRAALEALVPSATPVYVPPQPRKPKAPKQHSAAPQPGRTSRRTQGLGPSDEVDDWAPEDAQAYQAREVKDLKLLSAPQPYRMVAGRLSVDDALVRAQELAQKVGVETIDKAVLEEKKLNKDDLHRLGWSEARIAAYLGRHENPNAYYYRFNAPGEPQSTGGWTVEEHNLFMELISEGVDFHWGILSRAVPGRVGYQCANYYNVRFVFERSGLTVRVRRSSKARAFCVACTSPL